MTKSKTAIATVVAVLALAGATAAQAANWYVDPAGNDSNSCTAPGPASACKTITAAIGKASSGDTINVAIGFYAEQVNISKSLTLLGAQAGVDARTRSGAESTIDDPCGPVQITADNVVLDGFTVQGSTNSDPCFLAGIWTNPGAFSGHGGHQILNNIIQNNISGIELDNDGTIQTKVQFNLIQNNNNPGPGSGNGIQVNFGLNKALIDNNKFSGHTNSSVLVSSGGDDQQITVSNNLLVGGTPERIVFGSVDNSSITGNSCTGSTSSGIVRLFGGNNNIAVNSNILSGVNRGIRVDDVGIAPNTGISAHNNCITGNTIAGLEVEAGGHTGTLNAENNWWGSASGPMIASNPSGTGDKIIDPNGVVDYTPWLTSRTGTPCAPPPVGPPTNANQCKNDGWKTFNTPRTFKNQGDCIQFVNTGK
ncbi:MAG: right-handed parallel beta-helix repeat-containing protein [Chthoniobacterales bacterium]